MLRSAAKNHASVTVVVDPADYAVVLDELSQGETTFETRQRLAAKVFRHTAAYDALIAEYFTKQVGETKPEKLTITYDLKQPMRYGENPQQDADFYQKALPTDYSIASAKQLNGKELSFNNIRDADAAIRILRDFKDRPTVVALKHMNPCGIGQADDIETAWDYAMNQTLFQFLVESLCLTAKSTLQQPRKCTLFSLKSSLRQVLMKLLKFDN